MDFIQSKKLYLVLKQIYLGKNTKQIWKKELYLEVGTNVRHFWFLLYLTWSLASIFGLNTYRYGGTERACLNQSQTKTKTISYVSSNNKPSIQLPRYLLGSWQQTSLHWVLCFTNWQHKWQTFRLGHEGEFKLILLSKE